MATRDEDAADSDKMLTYHPVVQYLRVRWLEIAFRLLDGRLWRAEMSSKTQLWYLLKVLSKQIKIGKFDISVIEVPKLNMEAKWY